MGDWWLGGIATSHGAPCDINTPTLFKPIKLCRSPAGNYMCITNIHPIGNVRCVPSPALCFTISVHLRPRRGRSEKIAQGGAQAGRLSSALASHPLDAVAGCWV